jgi:hypothetical protein
MSTVAGTMMVMGAPVVSLRGFTLSVLVLFWFCSGGAEVLPGE